VKEDVLATVHSLLRLAVEATNIDEARNAALQACRLIRKHELRVVARQATARSSPYINFADEMFDDLFDNVPRRPSVRVEVRPDPVSPPPQPTVPRPKSRMARDPEAKDIPILNEPAWCQSCGQRILRGRFATWSKGAVYHPTCWKNATE
jgi:hypothetical protein